MANLMGFKRVNRMPSTKGHSIYDPLIDEARKTKGMYALDVEDKKRAHNLATTIRSVIRKREVTNVTVRVVETTVVVRYVAQH